MTELAADIDGFVTRIFESYSEYTNDFDKLIKIILVDLLGLIPKTIDYAGKFERATARERGKG